MKNAKLYFVGLFFIFISLLLQSCTADELPVKKETQNPTVVQNQNQTNLNGGKS